MNDCYDFGEWLDDEMERQEITRYELAKRSGLNNMAIYYYITYKRVPNLDSFFRILKALGKTVKIVEAEK